MQPELRTPPAVRSPGSSSTQPAGSPNPGGGSRGVLAQPVLAIGLAVLGPISIGYSLWGHWSDASLAVWLGSIITIVGAVLGAVVPSERARLHAVIAAGLMLSVGAFASTRAIGHWPFLWDAMADARYAAFITAVCLGVAVGLIRTSFWARWGAMAFGGANALAGILNSIHMLADRHEGSWLAMIGVIGGLTIFSQAARTSVRELFAVQARHALWSSRDRLVRSARWAAIASFAAAPMLLLYALGQPVAPQTVVSALVIAPVLFAGAGLVVARRAAGVLLLAGGGLAILVHTAASFRFVSAAEVGVVGYYAMFWLPAGVLGLIAGLLALRRAR